MRDTTIKKDISLTRFTKIQSEYIKINSSHIFIPQKQLVHKYCTEIDNIASELLIKISEHYKNN